MRTLDDDSRAALYAPQTPVVWLQLLTIEHADLVTPIRLVNNTEDIVSDGETFTAWSFPPVLPAEADGELPTIELTIDNVTREFTAALRALTTPITVTLEIIRAEAPDDIQAECVFESRAIHFSGGTIRIELGSEALMSETIPGDLYTPVTNPGLFESV